ncbi:hypothetical protein Tco_0773432 [Tanacetum coccineum]|uniref:Uncharacterized protein n=1 Tax=Tanacetum coccineum TaxID=301880 RepID=A0ABQ4ZNC8_9ASTR
MSDKKDEINKKNDYVYDKYGNVPVTDEMLDDVYNFAMMKKKFLTMVESEKVEFEKATKKIYRKLMVTDDMVELNMGKAKQAWDDVDLVDGDDVDLFDALDLKNRVIKLKEDFTRLLKAKKAKEAKEAEEVELKVNKEVVQVSSDECFSGDENVVCFDDVKYPLTDAEIKMFKETPQHPKVLEDNLLPLL